MKKQVRLIGVALAFIAMSFSTAPFLNSVIKSTREFDGYTLTDHYFTLNQNINNISSAAYISKTPTPAAIVQAAQTLPSDSFVVARDNKSLLAVKLVHVPNRMFVIRNLASGEEKSVACQLKGDMTALRAIEIAGSKNFNRHQSGIVNGYLQFNHQQFTLIEHKAVEDAVIQIARAELK